MKQPQQLEFQTFKRLQVTKLKQQLAGADSITSRQVLIEPVTD